MITIETIYLGELRTKATHLQSGNSIITDAPLDNQGKGEAFSPTDLLAAALASCMLTIMGIAARTHGFNIDGTKAEITKIMESNPRRV
ncbi:MAG TPA: osmotically inducible protein OsmC, partial [Bacteroidales bacterium]|nr:osmotically inducible protein OsmC [Bacteroidales bacterium]